MVLQTNQKKGQFLNRKLEKSSQSPKENFEKPLESLKNNCPTLRLQESMVSWKLKVKKGRLTK